MARLVAQFDWQSTSIGARATWPRSLSVVIDTILSGGFPAIALWGPELVQIYNDGYRELMGAKHPGGLGQPTRECWPEVWHINAPIYDRVRAGETVIFNDALYPLARNGQIEDVWLTLSYSPLRDDEGAIAGVLVVIVEVTDRVLAERAREELRDRQSFLLDLTDALRQVPDPLEVQHVAMRLLGDKLKVDRALYYRAEPSDEGWLHIVDSEYFSTPGTVSIARQPRLNRHYGGDLFTALEQGSTVAVSDLHTHPILTPEQRARYRDIGIGAFIAVPFTQNGRYAGGLSVQTILPRAWTAAEITLVEAVAERTSSAVHRALSELSLQESEERLSLAVEVGELASWDWDIASGKVTWNDRHFALQGYEPGEVSPSYEAWLARVHPDDRAESVALIEKARDTHGVYSHVFRIQRPDGSVRWCAARGRFFYDAKGLARRMIGVMEDVTERREAEKALQLSENRARSLLSELQHRVRNTLAIIRSIARRTGDTAQSVSEYRALLDGRLDAFSRTQALVTRDPLGGTDLEYIIAEELRPYILPRSSRIRIEGPKVRLRPKAAETMALAVHELATNAARYGALCEASGRIDVVWSIDREAGRVRLEWRERDGPPVPEMIEHKGLGSELIERMLVYDLDAHTKLDIVSPGLRCLIELPLNERLFVLS